MESRLSPSFFVAATLIVSVAGLGAPSLSRAAEVPAPTLLRQAIVVDEAAPEARVELRIDTEGLGESAEPMAAKITEIGDEVFAAQGVVDASDPLDPVIIVVVERSGDDENPGFVAGFSIETGGEIVPGSTRQADCSLCTRSELLDKIGEELPALVDLALEHQVPAAGGEEGGEEGGGEEGGGEEGGEATKPIGPLGFAGIGLAVVGVAGVGVGAAFVGRGVVPIEPTLEQQTNYRLPGGVVLVVGGTALIAGAVMIAVDLSKRKRARMGKAGARIEARGAGFAF